MKKITVQELTALNVCDGVLRDLLVTDDVTLLLSQSEVAQVKFVSAHIDEISIKGYEVLDENEEVVFDMPDVDILGDKIPDALRNLVASAPHLIDMKAENNTAVITLSDDTDTYAVSVTFDSIEVE